MTPSTFDPIDDGIQPQPRWHAHLDLAYGRAGEKTVLHRQERVGPLFVQKPFYPEGPGTCHTILVHPPGGVVGGDVLEVGVTTSPGSHAVITTPAAGKFYRSAGPHAVQSNRLHVAQGSLLEWLPQETIIYDQADVELTTRVALGRDAGFIGWEMVCLGLPLCHQPFHHGRLTQRFEIKKAEEPIFIDTLHIDPDDPLLTASWGLKGSPVFGTLAAVTGSAEAVSAIRAAIASRTPSGLFSVSRIKGVIVCRYIGDDVYSGLKRFHQAWKILRPIVTGRDICPPRIWST